MPHPASEAVLLSVQEPARMYNKIFTSLKSYHLPGHRPCCCHDDDSRASNDDYAQRTEGRRLALPNKSLATIGTLPGGGLGDPALPSPRSRTLAGEGLLVPALPHEGLVVPGLPREGLLLLLFVLLRPRSSRDDSLFTHSPTKDSLFSRSSAKDSLFSRSPANGSCIVVVLPDSLVILVVCLGTGSSIARRRGELFVGRPSPPTQHNSLHLLALMMVIEGVDLNG